jgi:hypothetical protein
MSDDPDTVEPFNHAGYREDIDRNGDGIPDRRQQGYDPSTGDPLDIHLPGPQRFDLQHIENVPVSRTAREALMSIGASYDNAEGNSRNPEFRQENEAAVKTQAATEQAADGTANPNFHERASARALWERRKHMPQKESGLLKNFRQIQSAPNEPKTGLEVFQSLGHGLAAGVMIGAKQAIRNREIRLWKENEEFLLEVARNKDRDAMIANDTAKDLRDITQGGHGGPGDAGPANGPAGDSTPGNSGPGANGPDDRGPGDGSTPPPSTGPGGGSPGSAEPEVQQAAGSDRTAPEAGAVQTVGPVTMGDIEPSPAANDQGNGIDAAGPKFSPQAGRERENTEAPVQDQAKGTEGAAITPPAQPVKPEQLPAIEKPAAVAPARANANVAAGAAVAVVAPVAAPIVTAAATHQSQREVGSDFQSSAKGPAAPVPAPAQANVAKSPQIASATAIQGQRRLGMMPEGSMRIPATAKAPAQGQGTLLALAASIKDAKGPVLSKGASSPGIGRQVAGLGMEIAMKVLNERQMPNAPVQQIGRDTSGIGR